MGMKMKRTGAVLLFGLAACVVATAVLMIAFSGHASWPMLAVGGTVVFIGLVFLALSARSIMDSRRGLPFQDEMSRKMAERASARAFSFMVFLLLALAVFTDDLSYMRPRYVAELGILGGGLFFTLSMAYYSVKGIPA